MVANILHMLIWSCNRADKNTTPLPLKSRLGMECSPRDNSCWPSCGRSLRWRRSAPYRHGDISPVMDTHRHCTHGCRWRTGQVLSLQVEGGTGSVLSLQCRRILSSGVWRHISHIADSRKAVATDVLENGIDHTTQKVVLKNRSANVWTTFWISDYNNNFFFF